MQPYTTLGNDLQMQEQTASSTTAWVANHMHFGYEPSSPSLADSAMSEIPRHVRHLPQRCLNRASDDHLAPCKTETLGILSP